MDELMACLEQIKWNAEGLVPIIAQDIETNVVLTQAWINREALLLTMKNGKMTYWSRSRQQLWHKGMESGHEQVVKEIRLDCDADSLLARVEQVGGIACHTGRYSCFYRRLDKEGWVIVEPVLKHPADIDKNKSLDNVAE